MARASCSDLASHLLWIAGVKDVNYLLALKVVAVERIGRHVER